MPIGQSPPLLSRQIMLESCLNLPGRLA